MNDPENELGPEERAALARLPREVPPPPALEETTVRALAARGLLRPSAVRRGRRLRDWGLAAAAAVAIFAGGFLAGRQQGAGTGPELPRFMLLLYEGSEYRLPPAGREAERVHEYSAWAAERGARGELEAGEKLADGAEVVIAPDGSERTVTPDGQRLAGFFLIRARDDRAALEIARTCPHVRYGGSIVVREIEQT
jgi:hypothetical protein